MRRGWEAYVGSSEKRELQQGTGTAVLQRQQEGCPWPKQLGARLVQMVKALTVPRHKVIVPPVRGEKTVHLGRRASSVKRQRSMLWLQCPLPPAPAHLLLHRSLPTARQVSHDAAGKSPSSQGAPVMASVSALYRDSGRGRGKVGATPQLPVPHSRVNPGAFPDMLPPKTMLVEWGDTN